ncbi:uncharacterized protein MCYG_02585 [Microsporum canis CBS 113480]|uniref:Uncharacterized protein n=1 Tax=Arthroderma otae (strain ATCC MYA-4605 / CBS 113480) TaxID=554155 RepID=C5FG81_ARTOC|nr:uncharacterized protein MCYG_02585 [Microsporum canis CBS 113480]EEQ29766.1 predicted protein [Microsporum canis CBS 113480]
MASAKYRHKQKHESNCAPTQIPPQKSNAGHGALIDRGFGLMPLVHLLHLTKTDCVHASAALIECAAINVPNNGPEDPLELQYRPHRPLFLFTLFWLDHSL